MLGDTGRLDVDYKFNSRGVVKISVGKGAVPHSSEYVDEVRTEYTIWVDDNYNSEIDQFNDAILNGTQPEVSEEESLRTARICDAIRKAGGLD